VELMVSLVISALVIAGALALLNTQQRTFQRSSADRNVQEMARVALEDLTTNLRMAGFGMEPAFAFDFGRMTNVPADRLPSGLATIPGYACPSGDPTCRDRTDGPDELVFHYRDPSFYRPLSSPPGGAFTSLTVTGPLNTPLRQGQILQVICFSGAMSWAYVTVAADVAADTSGAPVSIPLQPGSGNDFPLQNQVLAQSCYGSVAPAGSSATAVASAAKIFKVNRYRYFVQTYDGTGNVVAWGTAGARPYLMLDQGLSPGGAAQVQVVAPDVEDLQVVYLFPRSATPLAGATANTQLTSSAGGIEMTAAVPAYTDAATAATRLTHHPANIGAVRVSVVVRTAEDDILQVSDESRTLPAAGNRPGLLGPQYHRRTRVETTAVTPNLDVRAPYFPSYSTSATDRLNVGGG
jgi:type IV pilus assembly protein PilW